MKKQYISLALLCAATSYAIAGNGDVGSVSGASAQTSAVASFVVSVIPVSLVVGGSEVVGASMKSVFQQLSQTSRWTVRSVVEKGEVTELGLQSQDKTAALTVSIPTKQVRAAGVRTNDTVNAERLGQNSFALKVNGTALGVLADPQAKLSSSHEKR